ARPSHQLYLRLHDSRGGFSHEPSVALHRFANLFRAFLAVWAALLGRRVCPARAAVMWKAARPLNSFRVSRQTPTSAQLVVLFLAGLAMLALLFLALEIWTGFELLLFR